MKTIKQIADQLGLPKEKVKYQVRKLSDDYLVKQDNIIYITDAGVATLKALLTVKPSMSVTDDSPVTAAIDALTQQLAEKDKQMAEREKVFSEQLAAKDLQIAELLATGRIQAESIRADRNNDLLETGHKLIPSDVPDQRENQVKKKWQFWK